ncbi:MAG: hypothetical protein EOR68_14475 [Mesorhizobium sp.]|uniref:hypothetical protein n=1 Tax=Mesorhizobium sp. TaxID=1871066 RepID=UPI000FE5BF6B|nr:hypothetical protein [Mesorhizobium sp.]RWL99004.1 MAG: hypothetical protein EOR68_14475 [Mesorhizobium sp.]
MTTLMQRNARPIKHGAPTRLFDIGQAVRLKGGPGIGPKTAEIYRVTRTLPPRGNSPQYRIRSDAEPHERVVTEDGLEPADEVSDGGTMLIERTFGHGQGTEALEQREQEAKAGKDSCQG